MTDKQVLVLTFRNGLGDERHLAIPGATRKATDEAIHHQGLLGWSLVDKKVMDREVLWPSSSIIVPGMG